MAKSTAAPNREILEAALQGLESQRERLEQQIAQVRSMMGSRAGRPPSSGGESSPKGRSVRKKRVLTPEARKRIAAAQKKRWAAFRKTQA